MNYKIIVKPTFQREAKKLSKHYHSFKKDFQALIDELEANPQLGTDLGGGLRKIRMRIASKGERQKRWCKSHYLYSSCGDERNGDEFAVYL